MKLSKRDVLRISLLIMNGLRSFGSNEHTKETKVATFVSLVCSLLPNDLTIHNLFIITAAGVGLFAQVYQYSVDYIFWYFGIIQSVYSHLENICLSRY